MVQEEAIVGRLKMKGGSARKGGARRKQHRRRTRIGSRTPPRTSRAKDRAKRAAPKEHARQYPYCATTTTTAQTPTPNIGRRGWVPPRSMADALR